LIEERVECGDTVAPIFTNARGSKLTRFGVRYLLRKYVSIAGVCVPTICEKQIHPHSMRHTTAIHLLKAGVDFSTISQWLGHASLDTTMRYAKADIDMKRQALMQVFPDVLVSNDTNRQSSARLPILEWMRRL
jgi:integrase/recombinase XerD